MKTYGMNGSLDSKILPFVSHPAQYIGGEYNQAEINEAETNIRWALAFPDTYSVGMSHWGLKILYHVINSVPATAAERVFCPWQDMEEQLRKHNFPLYTLETMTPLKNLDIIGFSLAYELCYTNVLTMLDLSGVPLRSADRSLEHPFICAGGPCAYSAEPLAEFMDFLVLGDGEEAVVEITGILRAAKESGTDRRGILERLSAEVPGVYVPSLYEFDYDSAGLINAVRPLSGKAPKQVARRVVENLDSTPYPTAPVIPWTETIHDRYAVEIMRGCINGCRFCQAGMLTRPRRTRDGGTVLQLVEKAVNQTGYEEVSLLSLSSSDYPGIGRLAGRLVENLSPEGINVAFPSLRVGSAAGDLAGAISAVRKSGLTLAPEAATERLRTAINKPMSEDELFSNVREAYKRGYQRVKLYFMIGLPGETDEDVEAIAELAGRISMERRRFGGGAARVSVTISIFVPKPGTPFQWCGQIPRDEILRKRLLIKRFGTPRSVRFNFHDADRSILEALLSRGDRRLGKVIETAWRAGARFDSWNETFRMDFWTDAMKKAGLDWDFYTTRERSPEEILPWSQLFTGVDTEFLLKECRRSSGDSPRTTPPCILPDGTDGPCSQCSACPRAGNYKPDLNR